MAATYKMAVAWIAQNDNAGQLDNQDEIADYISVQLVADLYGKLSMVVAKDVMWHRRGLGWKTGNFVAELPEHPAKTAIDEQTGR